MYQNIALCENIFLLFFTCLFVCLFVCLSVCMLDPSKNENIKCRKKNEKYNYDKTNKAITNQTII